MDLAYAITCHKSQGSQFGKVIIPVASSRIMDRTLLYTAITRAQDQVVLVGDRQAFEKAIVSPPNPDKRETGILHLLRSEPDYL
jgi:exodeoxyribonuclease V alpha subunit